MIARGARLDPAGPRQVAREHTADRGPAGLAAQQGTIVGRLEGQVLMVVDEVRLDLGERLQIGSKIELANRSTNRF
jgi:hypothetical protein